MFAGTLVAGRVKKLELNFCCGGNIRYRARKRKKEGEEQWGERIGSRYPIDTYAKPPVVVPSVHE